MSKSADHITLLHKPSGTRMDVGKTAYDAGEFDSDEFEAIRHDSPTPSKPQKSKG